MNEDDFEQEKVADAELLRQWVSDHKSAKHEAELTRDELGIPVSGTCRRCQKVATVRG